MTSDPNEPGRRQPDLLGRPDPLGRDEEDADIPPPPHGLVAEPLDDEAQARLQRMSRRGRTLPALLVLVAIGAFVAIVWWAYRTANRSDVPAELPVVEAEPGEEKVRPESEGGMDVPNQDKLIYEQLGQSGTAEGEQTAEVERLLPPPEEPLEPPAPPTPPEDTAQPAPDTAALTPPPPPQAVPDEVAAEEAAPAESAAPPPDAAPAAGSVAEAPPPAVPAPEPAAPAAEAAPEPAAPETATAEPVPEAAPAAPAAEEPAPQVAAAGAFRIQLASVKSEADAQKEWTRLQKAHADLLGTLTPTIQRADLGTQGIFYRIQGGPLPSREAANTLCEQLKAKKQACLVVKP